jgi:hypothetical protein
MVSVLLLVKKKCMIFALKSRGKFMRKKCRIKNVSTEHILWFLTKGNKTNGTRRKFVEKFYIFFEFLK